MNPDARDSTTQQIQLKLGNYSLVKHLLDEPKRLIGIEGVPPSPAPPPAVCLRLSSNSAGSNSRSSPSSQEFKKPGGPRTDGSSGSSSSTSSSSTSSSTPTSTLPSSSSSSSSSSNHQQQQQQQQRGGFVKPADGKPPYGGRGSYPGQLVKLHGASGNDHRSHGLLPPKGPPTNSPGNGTLVNNSNIGNSSGSRLHSVGGRLSRLSLDNVSIDFHCFVAIAPLPLYSCVLSLSLSVSLPHVAFLHLLAFFHLTSASRRACRRSFGSPDESRSLHVSPVRVFFFFRASSARCQGRARILLFNRFIDALLRFSFSFVVKRACNASRWIASRKDNRIGIAVAIALVARLIPRRISSGSSRRYVYELEGEGGINLALGFFPLLVNSHLAGILRVLYTEHFSIQYRSYSATTTAASCEINYECRPRRKCKKRVNRKS